MRSSKRYENYKDLWFKILSNLVSEKTWLFAIATIALFSGLICQYVWMGLIASIYGIGKAVKSQWIKSLVNQEEPEDTE